MTPVFVEAGKIVVYAAAGAVATLLVGGAVKMLSEKTGEECIEAAKNLARDGAQLALEVSERAYGLPQAAIACITTTKEAKQLS